MKRTIVLIDDDADDLDIMKEAISEVDPTLDCRSFIYPEEALKVLLSKTHEMNPQIIFVDINMPRLTGDKCLSILRSDKSFNDVFIVMYSTSMPTPVSDSLKALGADFTYEKPVRIGAYAEIISSILEKKAAKDSRVDSTIL